MNEVTIFENPEFGKVRTLQISGEPYFIGKDVATILGYANPKNAVANHVDDEDKTLAPIQGGCSTGIQNTTIINESGLYSLILSSKLPKAKKFKRWITSEVLPTIRKTGSYSIRNMKQCYRGKKHIKVIYINVDMKTRYERMKQRAEAGGMTYAEAVNNALERIKNDVSEFYDYIHHTAHIDFEVDNNGEDNAVVAADKIYRFIQMSEREEEDK